MALVNVFLPKLKALKETTSSAFRDLSYPSFLEASCQPSQALYSQAVGLWFLEFLKGDHSAIRPLSYGTSCSFGFRKQTLSTLGLDFKHFFFRNLTVRSGDAECIFNFSLINLCLNGSYRFLWKHIIFNISTPALLPNFKLSFCSQFFLLKGNLSFPRRPTLYNILRPHCIKCFEIILV